ncbi:putative transcription factor interactor and regulator CCHC(Zn) family [Helianthus annuus]|nr:putative transcription factor interactor and regulator CCHC(Zn) family [Helianthus annuus]
MGTTPFCRNRTQDLLVPKLYPTPKMALDYKGTSADEEEKKDFWRQSNNEFLAKKQDEMKKMAEQKKDTRTCFQCNTVGHIARECSKAIQSKQGVSRKLKEQVVEFEPPIDRTKLFKNSTFEIGECLNRF